MPLLVVIFTIVYVNIVIHPFNSSHRKLSQKKTMKVYAGHNQNNSKNPKLLFVLYAKKLYYILVAKLNTTQLPDWTVEY